MIATIWPGAIAWAAGAVTCASTLPTATAMPSGSPVHAAACARQATGPRAQRRQRVLELVGDEVREAPDRARRRYSRDGYAPSWKMPL